MANQVAPKSQPAQSRSGEGSISDRFTGFVSSLGDVLLDITALEVNTMVVAQITGNKFSADIAYANLYGLNEHYLHYELGIHEDKNLCDRYLSLRNRVVAEAKKVLQEEGLVIDDDTFDLPNPDATRPQETQLLQKLLDNPKFLRTLRKANELKAGLDSTDSHSTQTDIIYAQTIIQLDGDVIHRYHELLFQLEEPQKRMIMDIHQQSVVSGEAQWRGLLGFMVNLVRSFIATSSNPITMLSQNGRN